MDGGAGYHRVWGASSGVEGGLLGHLLQVSGSISIYIIVSADFSTNPSLVWGNLI